MDKKMAKVARKRKREKTVRVKSATSRKRSGSTGGLILSILALNIGINWRWPLRFRTPKSHFQQPCGYPTTVPPLQQTVMLRRRGWPLSRVRFTALLRGWRHLIPRPVRVTNPPNPDLPPWRPRLFAASGCARANGWSINFQIILSSADRK